MGFGRAVVSSEILVPNPPARMTAFKCISFYTTQIGDRGHARATANVSTIWSNGFSDLANNKIFVFKVLMIVYRCWEQVLEVYFQKECNERSEHNSAYIQ